MPNDSTDPPADDRPTVQPSSASMPTTIDAAYLANHASATRLNDAHPIDDRFRDRAGLPVGPRLAAIQAVADQYIDECDHATLVHTDDTTEYYVVHSDTFYELARHAAADYDHFYLPMEDLQTIVALHTQQYLFDLHDYTGDFDGHDPTLCNALNDNTPTNGAVTKDTEPDNAHYGFVDARGLVVERGTHT